MKTKIFGLVAIVCIAFAASFVANQVSKSSSALSMVAAANVEALAELYRQNNNDFAEMKIPEGQGEGGVTCHQTCKHKPAVCWDTDWNYNNTDACCYATGKMSDKCYAYKCGQF